MNSFFTSRWQLRRCHSVITLLLLSVLSLLAGCKEVPVEPAQAVGRLEGQVLDARTGQPLANVTITTTPATVSVVTDTQGRFQIEEVLVGRLTITSKRTGYQQDITSVTVVTGQTATASIQLDKAAAAAAPSAPNRPLPADRATDQPVEIRLAWRPVNAQPADSLRYDVVLYESNSPDRRQVLSGGRDTTVTVPNLRFNTVYYWQVTVTNRTGGSVRSDIWSFRTREAPDNRFLYVRQVAGNTDIYSSDATGGNLIRLTSSPFVESSPRLSPLFDRIAYTSNATGQYRLYTMNRDGSDQRLISTLPVEGYHNFGIAFCWSPDGSQLIFANNDKLWRINRDGSGLILLATAPANRNFRECDWTIQGGSRIVIQTVGTSIYDSEIYLVNPADGALLTQLVDNVPGRVDSPSFNGQGTRIMYTRDIDAFSSPTGRQTNARIFTQNLDGTDRVDVSASFMSSGNTGKPNGFNDIYARFAPNGAKIIFVQVENTDQATPEVWQMDLDGRNRVRLFQNATLPDIK